MRNRIIPIAKNAGIFTVLTIFYFNLFSLAFDVGYSQEESLIALSLTASILTIYVWKKLVPLTD